MIMVTGNQQERVLLATSSVVEMSMSSRQTRPEWARLRVAQDHLPGTQTAPASREA